MDYLGVVKCLIEQGSLINEKDKNGLTPLHHAVEGGHLRIIIYLITNGANINSVSKSVIIFLKIGLLFIMHAKWIIYL